MFVPSRAIATLTVALVAGCSSSSKERDEEPAPEAAARPSGEAAANQPTPSGEAAAALPAPAAEPFAAIGVEPCDRYIEQQRACVSEHAPDLIKNVQLDGLAAIATRWRAVAESGAAGDLTASCEHLLQASRDATAAWECKW